jgi:hypothetical protein
MCRVGKRRVHGVRLRWVLMARMLGGIVAFYLHHHYLIIDCAR